MTDKTLLALVTVNHDTVYTVHTRFVVLAHRLLLFLSSLQIIANHFFNLLRQLQHRRVLHRVVGELLKPILGLKMSISQCDRSFRRRVDVGAFEEGGATGADGGGWLFDSSVTITV